MLEMLLGSKLRTKLLGWLFSHPDERYYVRQLTALLNEDSTNISRELARLEKTGILLSTIDGKQKYYQTNRNSPLFDELHGLIIKTAGIADVIKEALATRSADIRLALIFGSVARKAENRLSDIDLLVVGDISFGEITDLLAPAEDILKRELNPVVYTVKEFVGRLSENHHFISNILSDEKIFVIGDENELGALAGKRLDNGT